MEQRVSLISLGVDDLAASRAFYERMGWQASRKHSNENIVFFQLCGTILGLYSRQGLADEANVTPGDGFGGLALAHNARNKEEVDAVLAEAEQAGAKILKSAEEVFWGGYSGYFADPDNHVWEVAYNPFLPIAPDGSVTLDEED